MKLYIKTKIGEGTSTINCFKPPFKNNFPPTNKNYPPTKGINVEYVINIFKYITFGGEPSLYRQDEEEEEEG
jgi:hypothetical protein